ncbi:NAD(P)-binding protein [Xylariomycetidae sp. FL0641]|nr:NAD(P)-binding protein [Xylariomycetidae sp. FL0641]
MGLLNNIKAVSTQFWPPPPGFTEANVPSGSQEGKVFVVTGGNSGLGYELCKILFRSGATVYMATRSKERAESAIQSIRNAHHPNASVGQLKFIHLDLADLGSVRNAARQVAQEQTKVDVLWNNGGIGANAVKYGDQTALGLEILMGIHCVGALLFTELLLPQLRAAAVEGRPSRVVWLTSVLVDTSAPKHGVDLSALEFGIEGRVANYAASKAAVWMLARDFADRHKDDGVISLILNPGSLETGSFRGTPRIAMLLMKLTILHKPIYGAYTMLYAGLAPEIGPKHNGIFIFPWGRLVTDQDVARQDILHAMKRVEDGGLGYGGRLRRWCESKWALASET